MKSPFEVSVGLKELRGKRGTENDKVGKDLWLSKQRAKPREGLEIQ
jgi:hypothetical protein